MVSQNCSLELSALEKLHQARKDDTLASVFIPIEKQETEATHLWIHSPSDYGVWRNAGRRGAAFAPQAITTCFKKLQKRAFNQTIAECMAWNASWDALEFNLAQTKSIQSILQLLHPQISNIVQLGGGHDHIYPLVAALHAKGERRFQILNIDAHCDTRTDLLHHSGTPFRQIDQLEQIELELFQIGIHEYANSPSTLTPLKSSQMHCLSYLELQTASDHFRKSSIDYFRQHIQLDPEAICIFSLDCDALNAGQMEAVSAVNPQGLPVSVLWDLLSFYKQHQTAKPKVVGLYEYNPLMDNLSAKGAKLLAAFLYDCMIRA